MHSERALLASSLVIPLVLALHSASLLFGLAALADLPDKQLFMNALRSSPFLSPACALHAVIFSCCAVLPSLLSAAYAEPHTNKPNDSVRASRFFIEVFLRHA